MRQKYQPPDGLFKDDGDEDDKYTLRQEAKIMPSSVLKDELTATILRIAKERFLRRKQSSIRPSIEAPDSPQLEIDNDESSSSESGLNFSSRPSKQATRVPVANGELANPIEAEKTYDPVVSADDELSALLLKPSVQHIITQLDKTLTILHNARVAGLSYLSDSSETETEDESDYKKFSTAPKRRRGRPRLPPQPSSVISPGGSTSRRGRPKREHQPEVGETRDEMEERLARLSHRRLPPTEEAREAAFEEWLRQGDERAARERWQLSSKPASEDGKSHNSEASGEGDTDTEAAGNRARKIRRWGLRDWSDVVGAAALAGFPPHVTERTAQRCANLFGQGMALTRLEEVPAARAATALGGVRSTVYQPERIRLSKTPSDGSDDADDDDDYDDEGDATASLKQRRIASRQASLARSSREASAAETPRRGRGRGHPPSSPHTPLQKASPSRSRSRSLSRSSAGLLFCPIASCDRAATGFLRRPNLKRHMRLVHPGLDEDAAMMLEDSEDETVGAVHVDGFLRTINPGKGWRGGENAMARKRRRNDGDDVWPGTPVLGSQMERIEASSSGESE